MVSIGYQIVYGGNGSNLSNIPIGRGKGHGAWGHGHLCTIGRADVVDHIGSGLIVKYNRKGADITPFDQGSIGSRSSKGSIDQIGYDFQSALTFSIG